MVQHTRYRYTVSPKRFTRHCRKTFLNTWREAYRTKFSANDVTGRLGLGERRNAFGKIFGWRGTVELYLDYILMDLTFKIKQRSRLSAEKTFFGTLQIHRYNIVFSTVKYCLYSASSTRWSRFVRIRPWSVMTPTRRRRQLDKRSSDWTIFEQ